MAAQLIWIAVVYALAVFAVHVLHIREKTRQSPQSGKWIRYVLITRNHESVIEWYIRALSLHAFLTGKNVLITCMDDSSSDATLLVVSKLKQGGSCLEVEQDIGYYESRYGMPDGQTASEDNAAGTETVLDQRYGSPWTEQEIVVDLRLPGVLVPLPFMQDQESRGYGSKHGGI